MLNEEMAPPAEISSLMFPYSFPTQKPEILCFQEGYRNRASQHRDQKSNITTKSCLYVYNIQKKREKQLRENDRHIVNHKSASANCAPSAWTIRAWTPITVGPITAETLCNSMGAATAWTSATAGSPSTARKGPTKVLFNVQNYY
jgi:hypothetical protein